MEDFFETVSGIIKIAFYSFLLTFALCMPWIVVIYIMLT